MFTAITPTSARKNMFELPAKMFALPTYRGAVDKAISSENLKAVASNTTDPEVRLGLACLARTGDPVRQEIANMGVAERPEYAPIAAVLTITLDGIDAKAFGQLIKRDPDNALGYYLQGTLLHQSDKVTEALEAFRKAAHCSEMRLYESTAGPALFKALHALNLTGRDRLCALSWQASRSSNFSSAALQPIKQALFEVTRLTGSSQREEMSELLLILASRCKQMIKATRNARRNRFYLIVLQAVDQTFMVLDTGCLMEALAIPAYRNAWRQRRRHQSVSQFRTRSASGDFAT